MPNIYKIYKTMRMKKHNIPQEILLQLGFDSADFKFDSGETQKAFELLAKMNDMLTMEQKCAIMEQQGCHKAGKMDKESKAFAEKYSGKSLEERCEILQKEGGDAPYLNDDGTISYTVRCYVGDIDSVVRSCHCLNGDFKNEFKSFIEKHPDKVLQFSQFFCGCCAGHQKHHLQNRLSVKLRLKSIDTSSDKTEKGYPRVFVYEVLN